MRILLVLVVALVVFLVLRRKRGGSVPLGESSGAVDRWIQAALPAAIARHLAGQGVDRDPVARALGGDPDPGVVSTLEQHVRGVDLEYQRDPHVRDRVDVCARVRFEDGGEETVRTRMAYADVPSSVREDFERKATSRAFRAWRFPWVRAQ